MDKPQPEDDPQHSTPASDMESRDRKAMEWLKAWPDGCLPYLLAAAAGLGGKVLVSALAAIVPAAWVFPIGLLCVSVFVGLAVLALLGRIAAPPENDDRPAWTEDHLHSTGKPHSHGRVSDVRDLPILVFLFAGTAALFFVLFWIFGW